MDNPAIIEFEDDELKAASSWHGGISSMLYAITSTGSLKRGTNRPRSVWHDRPMTDEEWAIDLALRLESEAEATIVHARERIRDLRGKRDKASKAERAELLSDIDAMISISAKARRAAGTRYEVHTGRPSWHQQRAGHISAGAYVFYSRAEAVEYETKFRADHPDQPCFIVTKEP